MRFTGGIKDDRGGASDQGVWVEADCRVSEGATAGSRKHASESTIWIQRWREQSRSSTWEAGSRCHAVSQALCRGPHTITTQWEVRGDDAWFRCLRSSYERETVAVLSLSCCSNWIGWQTRHRNRVVVLWSGI